MAEKAMENGTVAIMETPIPAKSRKLIAFNPPLTEPESKKPLHKQGIVRNTW